MSGGERELIVAIKTDRVMRSKRDHLRVSPSESQ